MSIFDRIYRTSSAMLVLPLISIELNKVEPLPFVNPTLNKLKNVLVKIMSGSNF